MVTNDDGVFSPGLRAVVEAVLELGDVMVIAPRRQQSATGRALFGEKHERFERVGLGDGLDGVPAYCCDCSPAMAVQIGLQVFCSARPPDLLISGINYGENLGHNITLSGTVGAALEGAAVGIPGLAVSLQTDHSYHFAYGDVDWSSAQHFTRLFAEAVLAGDLPGDVQVLNVVLPGDATDATPWRVTRQAQQSYFTARMRNPRPDSPLDEAAFGLYLDEGAIEPGTDIHAIVKERIVSVTPLSLDLTSRTGFAALSSLLGGE